MYNTPLKLGLQRVLCESAVKMSKALYPLLDALRRGPNLHTRGEKIKFQTCTKLYFAVEEAKIHKSEGMLLQYSGVALVRDIDSNHTPNGTLHMQPSWSLPIICA